MQLLWPDDDAPVTVPYTAFKQEVSKGNVLAIYSRGDSIEGRFRAPVAPPPAASAAPGSAPLGRALAPSEPRAARTFTTTLPAFVGPGLEAFLIDHQVEISAVPIRSGGPWSTLIYGFGPALLLIAFYVWLYRRAQRPAPRVISSRPPSSPAAWDLALVQRLARQQHLEITGLPPAPTLPSLPLLVSKVAGRGG